MSRPAIRIENLGKRYLVDHEARGKRGGYKTLRESIVEACSAPFARLSSRFQVPGSKLNGSDPESCLLSPVPSDSRPRREEFWALKDVSFEVQPGEVVGIIGRNGAGKSTLLKILSRITKPTTGRVELHGRVGSLLEVGTGFHPELTGRENIYLNGSILGMRKIEIDRKFDEIVDFAEIEQFLDTPVKRYSSGMYTRLAFGVAAHFEPEILVVDEVLAVGDAAFQKKCLGKLSEVAAGGRTVLFVSHNMEAISTLTQRCVLLSRGRSVTTGLTGEVIHKYLRGQNSSGCSYVAAASVNMPKITGVKVRTSRPGGVQVNGEAMSVTVKVSTPRRIRGACLSIQIIDYTQRPIAHLWTFDSERPMCRDAGVFNLECLIPNVRLYLGEYSLKIYLSGPPGAEIYELLEGICPFEVTMYGRAREWEWRAGQCAYLEEAEWRVEPAGPHFEELN